MRRNALNPYFSQAAVTKLEPVVRARIDLFCARVKDAIGRGEVVNLEVALMAMATDIITEYCFAKSYGFLEKPDFAPDFADTIRSSAEASNLGRYLPWLVPLLKSFPVWVVGMIDPNMKQLIELTLVSLHERCLKVSLQLKAYHPRISSDRSRKLRRRGRRRLRIGL